MHRAAVFGTLKAGAPVWINDGKIGAVLVEVRSEGALLEITHAGEKGNKIKPDKGLNFPQTHIDVEG